MSEVEEKASDTQGGGFLAGVFNFVFMFALVFVILWNWDGFWQTDIGPLSRAQQSVFPVKFNEEQLKLSRIQNNNQLIEQMERRTDSYEQNMVAAEKDAKEAREALAAVRSLESEKCRYYDTALRMIDLLTRKYSEDELKQTLSCTSPECEEILVSKHQAFEVCS
ncbi:hypothetical protein SAMN05216369_1347 [Marinobacter antarcticus]|uniref:Uncharacterized protein n=1 Tax=Marinobacter antarcticus TaxID=564117 RepID=A0A1M6R7K0_9GAMM|nr:hypothetical protein [Marinobacter antarcticus]SHK28410.1 hypothetical protein SAMN05216369_1347 [Marinobacter antarcticus]